MKDALLSELLSVMNTTKQKQKTQKKRIAVYLSEKEGDKKFWLRGIQNLCFKEEEHTHAVFIVLTFGSAWEPLDMNS